MYRLIEAMKIAKRQKYSKKYDEESKKDPNSHKNKREDSIIHRLNFKKKFEEDVDFGFENLDEESKDGTEFD